MRTRVQKWGNSLALRIPTSYPIEARIQQDSLVDISLVDGKLVLQLIPTPGVTLEQLLAQVTPENRHGEVEAGPATGKEVW